MGKLLTVVLCGFILPAAAWADYYSCSKKIYATGWLKKYDYKGETWGANTKKSGALSSTIHVSTENTTSSVDPGVTTGEFVSSSQFVSSWGECAAVDIELSMRFRDDYLEQNLHEIKKQVALGKGYHVDSLAVLSGCDATTADLWAHTLQAHTGELYDTDSGKAFRQSLDSIITSSPELRASCRLPQG